MKEKIRSDKYLSYLMILLGILALLYVQILGHITIVGGDNFFHWARFYDIKEQLLTGKFSWFQTNFTFNQTGRVINALYGPLFAYLNAFLLLVVRSWFQYEIVTNILIDFIAAVGMYKLAVKVKAPKLIAVALSLIYINIGMIPAWTEGMNFSACAGVIIPYLLMQVVNLLEDREKPVHILALALCISLIGNIHLLSTLLIALILAPVVIISFYRTLNKKQFLIKLTMVIFLTLILTASVWAGLLVIYSQNHISAPFPYDLHGAVIRFSKFQTVRQFILPSTVVLFIGQFLYALWNWKKQRNNFIVTSLGFIYLLLGTNYLLNWTWAQNKWPFLASVFQFPFRLVTIAYPVLLLGIAYSFAAINTMENKNLRWNIGSLTVIFVVMQVSFATYKFISDIYSGQYMVNSVSAVTKAMKKTEYVKNLTQSQSGIFKEYKSNAPDYLPTNNKKIDAQNVQLKYDLLLKQIKVDKIKRYVAKNGNLILTWNAKSKGKIMLPIVMYRQSRLVVNGNKNPKISTNSIGAPTIVQRKGKNVVFLSFNTPSWFYLLLIISLIGWGAIISYYLGDSIKNISVHFKLKSGSLSNPVDKE